jgi:hypothetical protein
MLCSFHCVSQEIKVETLELPCEDDAIDQTSSQDLPPTPPSSASSDSEGTVSASCSPERRDSHGSVHVQSLRGFLQPRLYVTANGAIGQHGTSTRQPIHTPLISCQPVSAFAPPRHRTNILPRNSIDFPLSWRDTPLLGCLLYKAARSLLP